MTVYLVSKHEFLNFEYSSDNSIFFSEDKAKAFYKKVCAEVEEVVEIGEHWNTPSHMKSDKNRVFEVSSKDSKDFILVTLDRHDINEWL